MFLEHFGLVKNPFCKEIPGDSLFLSEASEEISSRLNYVANQNLFAVVTGECGTGKSTLLRRLRDCLDDKKFDFFYLTDSKLTPRHFYNGILAQMGKDGAFYRGDARRILHQEIEMIHNVRNRKIVIVVDEAHLLDREMLDELRFLLNFKMDSHSPLSLILSGQSELEEILEKKSSTAIRQRIDFCCRLSPLNMDETGSYIERHLAYAGAENPIFMDTAVKIIYGYSSGLPRLINKACTNCLMYAYVKKQDTIDGVMAKDVVEIELK
jgi:type II secretory pathway predicted ATPase ExeA